MQTRNQCVTFKMINRNQRFLHGLRNPGRRHPTNQDPTNQSRSGRGRNHVNIIQIFTRRIQRSFYNIVNRQNMRTRRQFRHHAAILLMFWDLRINYMRQNISIGIDNRGRCFITRRFNPQTQYRTRCVVRAPSRRQSPHIHLNYFICTHFISTNVTPILFLFFARVAAYS